MRCQTLLKTIDMKEEKVLLRVCLILMIMLIAFIYLVSESDTPMTDKFKRGESLNECEYREMLRENDIDVDSIFRYSNYKEVIPNNKEWIK